MQAVIDCPDTITVGNEQVFDGTETYLPGFDDFKYIWDFGDGSFGEGRQTTHIYHYPGRYRVSLAVQERPKNRKDKPALHSNYKNVLVVDSGQ